MTSNAKMMLQGLVSLAVVAASAGAHAQNLETPGTPAQEAAAAPAASSGPSGFGDSGQFVLSFERLFGYNWTHVSSGNASGSGSTFSILGNPFGVFGGAYPYDWPRLGFDYFVSKPISVGIAAAFARNTGGATALNAYEVAPRVGYGMVLGPGLAVWPRAGVTYVGAPNLKYLGITLDLQAVAVLNPHFIVTFAPIANIGVYGNSAGTSLKYTTLGAEFGFGIPF